MNQYLLLEKYADKCAQQIKENQKILKYLQKEGIHESFIFEALHLGYSGDTIIESAGTNEEVLSGLTGLGLIKDGKAVNNHHLTIPIFDDNKAVINIAFYNLDPKIKSKLTVLNPTGIFNSNILSKHKEIIFTASPIEAFLLMQHNIGNVTFVFGDTNKYIDFANTNAAKKAIFCSVGNARLSQSLASAGLFIDRLDVDFNRLKKADNKEYIDSLFFNNHNNNASTADVVREIENGFLFTFPHLNYRVIGNFHENALHLKVNIKAFTKDETFVDALDLYKNRERQNLVFHIMDRFNLRDQVQLENDLKLIIETIESHKEKKEQSKKKQKPELSPEQKTIGEKFLTNPGLIGELVSDFAKLGCVREDNNKILMYLVMTSRLLENPLHSVIISRSSAGKSRLLEITESLCPPEELESISDMSPKSLYYFGQNDLKHKFIVVGEKEGSKDSSYPLRELISRKSLTKTVPVKDITGQVKTITIRVNGPIALSETTSSGEVNPENLNRCFIISIDESQDQTRLIHEKQRSQDTLEGLLEKKALTKIIEKHNYAQRLLKKIHVVNPFAPLLTFPSARLQTRRDNDKLLKLIKVITFLHQYQREVKIYKLDTKEKIEYIECTVDDYRIAYNLLSAGILDNTLDDLPRPARELFDIIKKFLQEKAKQENTTSDKIIFDRKTIREYSAWSFAQVRNNFRTLTDYEFLVLVKTRNGISHQYKLNAGYSDPTFLNTILTPEQLEEKIKTQSLTSVGVS